MQPQYQPQYPQPAAPQYPQQPAAYPQPAYPPQGYPQQPAPQYPQQGYPQAYAQPQYAPAAPPAPPLPTGSLDGYWQQPSSSGGPSFKFNGKPIGTTYEGFVARPVTDADIRAQTNNAGQVQTYKDGRPKFVMVVPMLVQASQEFPEGQAGWWVKGQARDELARAMAEAGAPAGAPEGGAFIRVQLVNQRAVPNMNPQLIYRIDYQRPQGAAPAPASQPTPQQAPMPAPQPQAPVQPQAYQQPVPPAMQQPVPQMAAPAPAATAPTGSFSPEQQALFAKLTGQPAS